METPNETYISCHSCKAKNPSEATHCFQCKADLLPGRSRTLRLVSGGVGVLGLGIPIIMFLSSQAIPSGLLLICIIIPMITVGFGVAFSRTPLWERLTNRAERHLLISPSQSVLDLTKALEVATNDGMRCLALEKRGEALMSLGKLPEALSDFQACVKIPEPNRSQGVAYGLWKNNTTKASSKIDQIRQQNPLMGTEILGKKKD